MTGKPPHSFRTRVATSPSVPSSSSGSAFFGAGATGYVEQDAGLGKRMGELRLREHARAGISMSE